MSCLVCSILGGDHCRPRWPRVALSQRSLWSAWKDGGPLSLLRKLAWANREERVTGGWRNREKAAFIPKLRAVNCERGDLWRGEWRRCTVVACHPPPPLLPFTSSEHNPHQWGQYGRQRQEPPAGAEDKSRGAWQELSVKHSHTTEFTHFSLGQCKQKNTDTQTNTCSLKSVNYCLCSFTPAE